MHGGCGTHAAGNSLFRGMRRLFRPRERGPRPPIASEVREYKLSHLRRLDVKPGITGLWQVQGRQDPSFDSYVSLDVTYIENWSIWLDIKIIMRTVGVVLAGTGS